jgi:FPC/CPF motif-containing protein YcgG
VSLSDLQARDAFDRFVADKGYPCVMAKSALKRRQYALHTYGALSDPATADRLAQDLAAFAGAPDPERGFRSFVSVYGDPAPADEHAFERDLWALLGALHARDAQPWDAAVSSDPADPTFSFSFAGRGFYVVGMHPRASRPARRFEHPLIVFNLHAQFEQLRAQGRYDKVKGLIRERDRALAGSVNPMMDDFGSRSEARQYAGRAVEAGWKCPFHAAHAASTSADVSHA